MGFSTVVFLSIRECITVVIALFLLRHTFEITSWGKLLKAMLHVSFFSCLQVAQVTCGNTLWKIDMKPFQPSRDITLKLSFPFSRERGFCLTFPFILFCF